MEITGETDESGNPLTTIYGGEWAFFTPYPSKFPGPGESPLKPGPNVAIHGIRFVESSGTAIHLAYSGGALLHHNVITQMRARATATAKERAAIVVGPAVLGGAPNTAFVP